MKPYVFKLFPALRWHPKSGEAKVFHAPNDVPAGWLDHHPGDPAHQEVQEEPATAPAPAEPPPATEPPAGTPLTRDEIIAELERREVGFLKTASTAKLLKLLQTPVETGE